MSFAAIIPAIYNFLKRSKKNSSTLQKRKATDFCLNTTEYYGNIKDVFPDIQTYTKIFHGSTSNSLERTSLSVHLSGIITVEASVILPIYIFVIATLLYLFNILYIETIFQERLSEIARDISSSYYAVTALSELSDEDKSKADFFQSSLPSDLPSSIINTYYINSIFFNDRILELTNSNYIINNRNGISFIGTSFDSVTNELLIKMSYKINIPFLPSLIELPITQYCKINLYTGKHITDSQSPNDTYVYICISGNVYHTNKYCSYLLKYTSVLPSDSPALLELLPCLQCRSQHLDHYSLKYVYLTDSGDCYHYSLDCSTFTRGIYKVKYEDISDTYHICTRCEENIK